MRAGLFRVDDLRAIPLLADIIAGIAQQYPGLDDVRRGAELVRELISYLIGAVMAETSRRVAESLPQSAQDVRAQKRAMVALPADVATQEREIKTFLFQHMYRHARVMRVMREAEQIVGDLFERYRSSPGDLPAEWLAGSGQESEADRARRIGNFIAGMTDRYALIEHQRLFDSTPDLR